MYMLLETTPSGANRVREIRTARGISAAELARRVHLTRQAIHHIESAPGYWPRPRTRRLLAEALGVTPDELFIEEASDAA